MTLEPGSFTVTEDTSAPPLVITSDNSGNDIDGTLLSTSNPTFSTECSEPLDGGETKTCVITNAVFVSFLI